MFVRHFFVSLEIISSLGSGFPRLNKGIRFKFFIVEIKDSFDENRK